MAMTPPAITNHPLNDLVSWLKNGDYIVVHSNLTCARYFHKCTGEIQSKEAVAKTLDCSRVTFINVSKMPGLLAEGEWETYVKIQGFGECCCALKQKLATPVGIPHLFRLALNCGS